MCVCVLLKVQRAYAQLDGQFAEEGSDELQLDRAD